MSNKLVCMGGERWGSCGIVLHWERQWDKDPAVAIRCLDCGSLLCPRCAREHFTKDEKDARILTLERAIRDLDDVDGLACFGEAKCAPYARCVACLVRAALGPPPAGVRS